MKTGAEVREGQRIAKVMARAGLCSRRDAEAWIAAGRVTVNGQALDSPAYNVSAADDVRVDGQPLAAPERTRLFLFHKPRGLVTTARDPEGRATIFDALSAALPRVVAIGRLDINTEGLLLLTNDGGLARVLELPATGWLRRYRVRAHGSIDQGRLDALGDGLTLEGVHYAGIEARLDREQGSNVWITMGLREGKNREIKKVLEHLGLIVNRLIRVSFGPFELGDLGEGEVAEVRSRVLRDQLGVKLAREAGVDFDAPLIERAAPASETKDKGQRERAPSGRGDVPTRKRGPGDDRRERRFEPAEPSRRKPAAPSAPERRRKHVSALRAEVAADAGRQRKRVERSATQDRKGRTIAVERIKPAGARSDASAETRGSKVPNAAGGRRGRTSRADQAHEQSRRADSRKAKQAPDREARGWKPHSERAQPSAHAEFDPSRPDFKSRHQGATRRGSDRVEQPDRRVDPRPPRENSDERGKRASGDKPALKRNFNRNPAEHGGRSGGAGLRSNWSPKQPGGQPPRDGRSKRPGGGPRRPPPKR